MGATGILLNPLGAPTLNVVYCSISEIEAIYSIFGVNARLDDDQDGYGEVNVGAIIEQATSMMNRYLLKRYGVTAIAATTWAKWCCATLGAVLIARRRGNDVPQSILDERDDYLEALKAIGNGQEDLIADDGPASTAYDETPTVSNLTVDGRFTRQKVRRVPTTSTGGGQKANGRMQNNAIDYQGPWS
jgi:hypothetical protein